MAQPRTRPRAAPSSPVEPRPRVREFTGASAPYEVEFDARTAYDFAVSISLDEEDLAEVTADDRKWWDEARAGAPRELESVFASGHNMVWPLNLDRSIVEHPEITNAGQLVELVDAASDEELLAQCREELAQKREIAEFVEAALAGDAAAIAGIERTLGVASVSNFLRDPARWLGMLRKAYRYWLGRYQPLEPRIGEILERDVAARAADRATLDGPNLVERTTGGIRLLADPGVRRVILAPGYFGRPYNRISGADGWRLFIYPIADSALGGADRFAPPASAVRLYRALGDETRLKILKLLAERDHYLTELAQALDLSKPTIKHHLAQLRVAGLVTLTEEGSLTYYSLRTDKLDSAGKEVRDYLTR